jgi:hypothetical protein
MRCSDVVNRTVTTHPRGLFRDETPVPGFQYHYIRLSHVTTRIWIEAVKRPDGRKHYTAERGLLLLIARLGGPDGEILVEGTQRAL